MADSGLVYISGSDWPNFKDQMDKLKGVAARASDKTLAYIGAEGRRVVGKKEDQQFEFNAVYGKWKRTKKGERGYFSMPRVRSHYDATHGWYKTSDDRRMIGFSFENALTYQKKTLKKIGNVSMGYVYSLMANLWNNPTKPYSKGGLMFQKAGERLGGWGKGSVRPAKVGLTTSAVEEAVTPAMRRATDELERMIVAEGLG